MSQKPKDPFGSLESLGILRNWNPIPKDSHVWLKIEMGIGILGWDWIPKAIGFSIPSRWGGILNSIKEGIWQLPFYPSPATAASPATSSRPSSAAPATARRSVALATARCCLLPPSRRAVMSFCISEIKLIWHVYEPKRIWNWIPIPFPANQTEYGIGFQFLIDSNSNSVRNIFVNQTPPNSMWI